AADAARANTAIIVLRTIAARCGTLLARFRLPAFCPVLPHPLGHGLAIGRRHRALPASRSPCGRCLAIRGLPSAPEELRELLSDCRLLLLQLLETRDGTEPCQPPKLL